MIINTIAEKIKNGYSITIEEAHEIASHPQKEHLYSQANEIRKHFRGNYIDLCSITNAKSGKCSEDCKWCSQSAFHATNIVEYDKIDRYEALSQAINSNQKKVHRHSLVTSGRKLTDDELDYMLSIYKDIKEKTTLRLCASFGLLNLQQLQRLKEAGISRYHCNIETAPSYFPQVCTTHTIEEKLQTITWAHQAGLNVCSGVIIGMGETEAHRIEMAFTLKNLKVLSIPINILTPIEGPAIYN
ncbi:MAG: biotin synthase BioB, partial [Bacteroidales bacterium]